MIDVVVSHYNKKFSKYIDYLTLSICAFLTKNVENSLNIIISDGSPRVNMILKEKLSELKVEYLHAGKELSFAETYNYGIIHTSSDIVVTLANDIFIEAKQILELAEDAKENVGCVIPYLSYSDYSAQISRKYLVPKRCFPSRMTFNVNVFQKKALEAIGMIDEKMSGCFNDVVTFIKLRKLGYNIVLKNVGNITHLSQQTLKTNSSNVSYENDEIIFRKKYPQYWRLGHILFNKTAQRRTTKIIYWILEHLPVKHVKKLKLWAIVWKVEPYITAEKFTYIKGVKRLFDG